MILLIGLIGIVSRSSFVQTYIVQKLAKSISNKYQLDLSVDKVYLSGFRTLNLDNVKILDHHMDTMIFVKELHADISLRNIISNNTLFLTNIILDEPYFYLHKAKGDSVFNINYFIQKISPDIPNDTSTEAPIKIELEKIKLTNGFFVLKGDTVRDFGENFNPDLIQYSKINAQLQYINIHYDSLDSQIDSLHFQDNNGSHDIRFTNTHLFLNGNNLILQDLDLRFNDSHIQDYFAFRFEEWTKWTAFEENVEMNLSLDKCNINTSDLKYFFPFPGENLKGIGISGDFKGFLNSFSFKNFNLNYRNSSYFSGDINIEGLPEIDNAIISLKLNKSVLKSSDFKVFFDSKYNELLDNISYVDLKGHFDGFYFDFVADGIFNTAMGSVRSDINFKIPENGPARYSGKLNSRNFKIGKLINREDLIKSINIDATLDGKGLDLKSADLKMKARIFKTVILDYKYNEITFDARLKENLFDGTLNINDSALSLKVTGLVNLNDTIEKIDVTGEIFKADLDEINLTEKDGFVKGKIDLDFTGLTFDRSSGNGYFSGLNIFYDDKFLEVDTLSITSILQDSIRRISITSDLFDASINGNFRLKELFDDFNLLKTEYELQIANNTKDIEAYYSKSLVKRNYRADWNLNFYDINPIMSLFFPELFISQNTKIQGRISIGNTKIFNLYTKIDTFIYDRYQFYDNEIDISSSKYADSSNILAFIFLDSKKQIINDLIEGQKLSTEIVWNNQQINFDSYFQQLNDSNFIQLGGNALFKKDSTVLSFRNSDFKIFENNWNIIENNEITIIGENINIKNLKFSSTFESIKINGNISRNPKDLLSIDFVGFNLRNINPLISRNISGVLNAELDISNIYGQFQTFGKIRANDCTIEGFLIGDIVGTSDWDNNKSAIVSNYKVDRLGSKILELEGLLTPKGDTTYLSFVSKLNNTNLSILEPFTEGLISEIQGFTNGYLALSGTNFQPILKGQLDIKDGGFKVDYLNSFYTFNETLYFNTDNISANNLTLTDRRGNKAILNGGIYHDGFSNPVIDLNAKLDNFEILNTTEKDNALYYGSAVASGDINFLGSFNDIQIAADLESRKGTFISIPTDNYTELEKETHISFLSDQKDLESNIFNERDVDLTGISMNFNLNITPDARIEIILDKQTGDIIKGSGTGEINMEIDTRGEFNMFGFYEINKGSYNFTLLNVVNKEFTVKEGGRISWSGDPYEGQLDLIASYRLNVPLKPLMVSADSVFLSSPQASKRSPVSVDLHLTGQLLNPDFNFDINIQDPPIYQGYDFNNDLLAFQNRIQNNEDALNREVFSLIVLKQFSQDQSGGNQPAGRNLSELLSNQLSNYLSSVNENLEINLDLSGLSSEDLNALQLRLSYTLLEGRLRLTREGGFTNSTNEADVSSIIGDWTIEYALTENGQLKGKMFNRNNSNVFQPGTRSTNTTGISILYTKSFDDFIELIKKQEKEKSQNREKDISRESAVRKEDLESKKLEDQ